MSPALVNDLLNYDLKIVQDNNFFKFSIDSVMLAEFVKIDFKDKKLLDLCTGNAPLPIILSKYNLEITGIELQKSVYKLAKKSIKLNEINNVNMINDCIKKSDNYFPGNNFDIITCNPPYFKIGESSIINEQKEKAIARHEIKIKLEEIIQIAYNNLRNSGKFYLVHRTNRLIEIINLLSKNQFGIKRMQMVYYDKNSECSMILIEAKKNNKNDIKIMEPLFIKDFGGTYEINNSIGESRKKI